LNQTRPLRQTKWGPQTLLETVGGMEIWETMPKVNRAGLIRREIGEQVILGSAPFTVIEVTLSGALCRQSGPKVVQQLDDDGNEVDKLTHGSAVVRVGAYREPDDNQS
jgi:hypothetical protein